MKSEGNRIGDHGRRPPEWLSWGVCFAAVAFMLWLRLVLLGDRYVALADALPLLICVWSRSRKQLLTMAAIFTCTTLFKVLFMLPEDHFGEGKYGYVHAAMMLANIWLVSGVVLAWMTADERVQAKNAELEQSNAELEASNEELAAREEEITRQNEELQSQTEELEQQTEELQQQTEELQSQGEELQEANEEAARRELALEILLDTARWLRSDIAERDVMGRICTAALRVMEDQAGAAAIVEREGEQLIVRGHCGLGEMGAERESWPLSRSFAALVMERGKTAYLEDVGLRGDLEIPQPVEGQRLRSVLASPIRIHDRIVGAVEVYSSEPRKWDEKAFKIIEWLAAQIGLLMETMRLEGQLEQRRREAEDSAVRKTRFLAAVSHDVRTPANAINLMAEVINQAGQAKMPAEEIAAMARELQASARLLVELVSDVLDLARFDSGRQDLQASEFELGAMVQAEVQQLQPLAREQGLELAVRRPGEALWLRTDRMKLARVLGNLVGNAIKFTQRGSVRVECSRAASGDVEVKVIDTGVGIPAEHLGSIFDEFFQLRNPARDRSKGTGLGLAICRRLVETMGCTVSVESEMEKGSTFTVRIPDYLVVEAPVDGVERRGEGKRLNGAGGVLEGVKVLLVEDHEMTRRATAHLLSGEGATVMQAESGRAALQLLTHEYPQVLLLDLMLPDMDGADVLRRVRERRPASLRCVLAVTGDVAAARAQEVKALGADALIPKPIDMAGLVGTMKELLRAREKEGGAVRSLV